MRFFNTQFFWTCLLVFIIDSSALTDCKGKEHLINQDSLNIKTINIEDIKKDISAGLKFLADSQRKETIGLNYFKGEWPSYIQLRTAFFLLGAGRHYDSNCFAVASIHNVLAELYLVYPEYITIPPMLDLAMEQILTYRTDSSGTFGFWKYLPPNRKLKKGDIPGLQPLVRRPTNYPIHSRFVNNAANIFDDADDTVLGLLSFLLHNRVIEKDNLQVKQFLMPNSVGTFFSKYRDINRKNILYYNLLNGPDFNTGAFLTWFGKEHDFKKASVFLAPVHYTFWFIPYSSLFPHAYKPYIPYGANDLDAVKNANILSALASFGIIDSTEGVNDACKFVTLKIRKKQFDRAGMYYPNRYHLHFAVSRAYASSDGKYLKEAARLLIANLKAKQEKDGSWRSRRIVNRRDIIQSTANALGALLNFGDFEHNETRLNIDRAVLFLHNNAIEINESKHWKGGVYFSGGSIVRNTLYWESDSYTTAIIIEAFAKYRRILEHAECPEAIKVLETN